MGFDWVLVDWGVSLMWVLVVWLVGPSPPRAYPARCARAPFVRRGLRDQPRDRLGAAPLGVLVWIGRIRIVLGRDLRVRGPCAESDSRERPRLQGARGVGVRHAVDRLRALRIHAVLGGVQVVRRGDLPGVDIVFSEFGFRVAAGFRSALHLQEH